MLTREATESEREPKRPRTVAAVHGRRVDGTMVQERLVCAAAGAGGADGRRHVLMTIVSGPSGFNTRCEELVQRKLASADRGEVVVLDA